LQAKEKLRSMFVKQKEFLYEYDQIVKEFEENDIVNQNEELQNELQNYKQLLAEIKEKHKKIQDENQNLRTALQEQVFDEKLNILKISKEKLNTYFQSQSADYDNELVALEESAKKKKKKKKKINLKKKNFLMEK